MACTFPTFKQHGRRHGKKILRSCRDAVHSWTRYWLKFLYNSFLAFESLLILCFRLREDRIVLRDRRMPLVGPLLSLSPYSFISVDSLLHSILLGSMSASAEVQRVWEATFPDVAHPSPTHFCGSISLVQVEKAVYQYIHGYRQSPDYLFKGQSCFNIDANDSRQDVNRHGVIAAVEGVLERAE